MKKIISYLITIMMVFAMIPYTAFAESASKEMTTPAYTWINPVYEDVISEEDFDNISEPASLFSARVNYATTPEEAIAVVKDALINKVDSFMLYYKYSAAEATGNWFDEFCTEIFTSAFDHTGVPYEGDYLYYNYGGYDIPDTSIKGDGTHWYMEIPVSVISYTTYEQEEELAAAIDTLLSEIIKDGMTDYEKVKAIYDYMTANIIYDYENYGNDTYILQYTAYAALIKGTSVCQGYANLFYRMALECGIDTRIIEGIANDGPHAWNIVKLGGKYYQVDATWDAYYAQAGYDYSYFLKPYFDDHTASDKFLTDEFKAAYPMADSEYVPGADSGDQGGSEGEDPENPTEPEEPEMPKEPEVCTHEETEVIPAVDATCTATGLTEGVKCASCGEVLTEQVIISALGHTPDKNPNIEPTCENDGLIVTVKCSVCGEIIKEAEVIPALGHTSKKTITKATTAKAGSIVETCETCGQQISKTTIAKINAPILSKAKFVYDGKAKKPGITVKDANGTALKQGTDFTVKYINASGKTVAKPINVGTYRAVVTFKGNYSGSVKKPFTINPKATVLNKLTKPGKKQIKLTWQKCTAQVTGYEIQYSTTKNFTKKTTKTLKVKNFKTNTKTIKQLKVKKKYWVKIRTYKNVNGKTYYSAWSKVKTITTK